MRVIGLHGQEMTLNFNKSGTRKNASSYHTKARELLNDYFSLEVIYEELGIPGTLLTLDFFIPRYKVAVEVQGEQHYKFIGHFHKNKLEFYRAKKRDQDKRNWCEVNNFDLIEFPYNEDKNEWLTRIQER
jgi:hypothetical protein